MNVMCVLLSGNPYYANRNRQAVIRLSALAGATGIAYAICKCIICGVVN